MDASEKIALLEKLNAQEEERMNQLLLAEKAAEEEKKKLVELALQKRLEDERREKELLAQQEEAARRQREVAALRQSQVREQAERDRATSLARQVSRAPTVSKRSQPRYPSSARKAGFEGTTRISATVTSSGKVEAPHVVVSSGHSSLDSSALAAVKKWHFNPAQNSVGDSIAYQLTIPVTFRLN
ncbi:MAG: energy transducer TonB [Roseibacillus sp.]